MSDSRPPLAPWIATQLKSLLAQRGHAWLLAGPSGLGQFELALALVSAWLCEHPSAQGGCGQCSSCHAIEVHTHADLFVLMPELTQLDLGWTVIDKAPEETQVSSDGDGKKRKPSKEIKVEAMREAVEFAQRTNARGRGKAVLVFPAERMNIYTANALLKTLEEPPGDVKFVLATEAAHQLLPTIRSRCLGHNMVWPDQNDALQWLQQNGMSAAQAIVALRAAGDRPQDALAFAPIADIWRTLPHAVKRGDVSVFKDWLPAQTVNALHKICHDALALKAGAQPRFFEPTDIPQSGSWRGLTDWAKSLAMTMRTVEHPFSPGLMQEALVRQAQMAFDSR